MLYTNRQMGRLKLEKIEQENKGRGAKNSVQKIEGQEKEAQEYILKSFVLTCQQKEKELSEQRAKAASLKAQQLQLQTEDEETKRRYKELLKELDLHYQAKMTALDGYLFDLNDK